MAVLLEDVTKLENLVEKLRCRPTTAVNTDISIFMFLRQQLCPLSDCSDK